MKRKLVGAVSAIAAVVLFASPAGASPGDCAAAGAGAAGMVISRCMMGISGQSAGECANEGLVVGTLTQWYCEILGPP